MHNAQFAEPSRHPSGATLPFKEGKFKVCTFGATTSQLRAQLDKGVSIRPPRKNAKQRVTS